MLNCECFSIKKKKNQSIIHKVVLEKASDEISETKWTKKQLGKELNCEGLESSLSIFNSSLLAHQLCLTQSLSSFVPLSLKQQIFYQYVRRRSSLLVSAFSAFAHWKLEGKPFLSMEATTNPIQRPAQRLEESSRLLFVRE